MVCYARPASWLAAIAIAAFLILGRPVSHCLDTAAMAVAVTAVIAGTAIAAGLTLAAVMSTRRRGTADRRAPAAAHPGAGRRPAAAEPAGRM